MTRSSLRYIGILGLALIILLCGVASAAGTQSSSTSTSTSSSTSTSTSGSSTAPDPASLVYVSGVDSTPQVFYPYEQGTITVHLFNSGTTSVGVSQPDLIGNNVHVTNTNSFQTMSYIGPGASMDVSFVVTIDPPDGTYYPLFSIGTKGSSSIHYPVKVVVDSTDLRASISSKPDNFAASKMDTVNLSITNPRDAPLTNILVITEADGVTVSPSEFFVSTLNASNSAIIPFQVTPSDSPNLTFHVSYSNGDNKHSTDVNVPFNMGTDKTGASPVVNDIALSYTGGSYQMTGDVTNAGITDAKSMVVTTGSPVHPEEPYPNYAIGTLASDDFSSFTLTFSGTDLSSVPVNVQWKDAQGNTFTSTTTLDLRNLAGATSSGSRTSSASASFASGTQGTPGAAGGAANRGGGGGFLFGGGRGGGGLSAFYPVIIGAIILVAGIVLYTKRKWVLSKIKKQ